jgi:ubiquinone biosynthesis protein UbiJ
MNVILKSQTIGAIRRFVSVNTSRDGLKELLLEAGASADRLLPIQVTNNTRSSDYKSMSELLSLCFDTIYQDFQKPDADGILLRSVGFVVNRRGDSLREGSLQELERGLAASGTSVAQVTEATAATAPVEVAFDKTSIAQLREASELLAKGLRRLSTDPPGAITACTSACESVCRTALEKLGLPLPAGKQLPDYLVALCQQTNLEALARVSGEESKKVFSALRALAQASYQAAHQLGDRHAHGDQAPEPSPFGTELVVMSSAAITALVAGALARNELKPTVTPTKTS